MLALTAPIVLTPLITYLKPENYDFAKFREIELVDDSAIRDGVAVKHPGRNEKSHDVFEAEPGLSNREMASAQEHEDSDLLRARNIALGAAFFIAISMTILWPIPMYGTGYVFSKRFFTGWIVVTFIWGFFGAITITCFPLWQSRREITAFLGTVVGGLSGQKHEQVEVASPGVVVQDKFRKP
jgi:hypothetical protein